MTDTTKKPMTLEKVRDTLREESKFQRTTKHHVTCAILETLANSIDTNIAAQREGDTVTLPKWELLIALRDEIDERANAEPLISEVYNLNLWMDCLQEAAGQLRSINPPPPRTAVTVTDEMVDIAKDAFDDMFDGSNMENSLRAALEAVLKGK